MWREKTFPSISFVIGRVLSFFRRKLYGYNPSEMYIKVIFPAPTLNIIIKQYIKRLSFIGEKLERHSDFLLGRKNKQYHELLPNRSCLSIWESMCWISDIGEIWVETRLNLGTSLVRSSFQPIFSGTLLHSLVELLRPVLQWSEKEWIRNRSVNDHHNTAS